MKEKTWVVVNPFNMRWGVKFESEDAGWSRVLASSCKVYYIDRRKIAALKREGWRVFDTKSNRP